MIKRFIVLSLMVSIVISMVACTQRADAIALPLNSEVDSISVTDGSSVTTYSDNDWIKQYLSVVSEATVTNIATVQDVPTVSDYIRIDINSGDSIDTHFVYEDNGEYYIEQPYHGIYKTDISLYQMVVGD